MPASGTNATTVSAAVAVTHAAVASRTTSAIAPKMPNTCRASASRNVLTRATAALTRQSSAMMTTRTRSKIRLAAASVTTPALVARSTSSGQACAHADWASH